MPRVTKSWLLYAELCKRDYNLDERSTVWIFIDIKCVCACVYVPIKPYVTSKNNPHSRLFKNHISKALYVTSQFAKRTFYLLSYMGASKCVHV